MSTLIWGTLVISGVSNEKLHWYYIIYSNVENGCVESLKAPGCRGNKRKKGKKQGRKKKKKKKKLV